MSKTLFTFGHGYCAQALARRLIPQGWQVLGTARSPDTAQALSAQGVTPVAWDKSAVAEALEQARHVLISAGPKDGDDPSLALAGDAIAAQAGALDWVGYLSTTGVYGDHGGAWIDETAPLTPSTKRGQARARAEAQWQSIADLPLHIFRLAGIYGPGRGPFTKLRRGTARRIIKPDQVFSRIHVDDIAQALHASIQSPKPGAIYNTCDDDPAPPQDVIAFAAELLNMPVPPAIPFEQADFTPMARSFYSENKRISNSLLKSELGITLLHPDYRSGLRALLQAEER